jgi:predicted DNA-binding protein (UPF0251 family)
MPRPRKRRRVCELPETLLFKPAGKPITETEVVIISIDEYEVIRLIDLEGLNQEECAERMEVARSTIQRMYEEVKRKVADSIVNGKAFKIEGGDYKLCDFNKDDCTTPCCMDKNRNRAGMRRGAVRGKGRVNESDK